MGPRGRCAPSEADARRTRRGARAICQGARPSGAGGRLRVGSGRRPSPRRTCCGVQGVRYLQRTENGLPDGGGRRREEPRRRPRPGRGPDPEWGPGLESHAVRSRREGMARSATLSVRMRGPRDANVRGSAGGAPGVTPESEHSGLPADGRIAYEASPEIRDVLATIGRTEDITLSPDNTRLAVLDTSPADSSCSPFEETELPRLPGSPSPTTPSSRDSLGSRAARVTGTATSSRQQARRRRPRDSPRGSAGHERTGRRPSR